MQIITNILLLIFRIVEYYIGNKEYAKLLARPAAVFNSLSSILYTLVFAITDRIFTNFEEEIESEPENNNRESRDSSIMIEL